MSNNSKDFLDISDKKLDFYYFDSKKIETLTKLIFLRNYFARKKNSTCCLNSTSLSESIRYWTHVRWTLNTERIKRILSHKISDVQNDYSQYISFEPSISTNNLKLFHDIICYPIENLMHPSQGGPEWKDWDVEIEGRISIDKHFDDARCSDKFKSLYKSNSIVKGYWLWGGFLVDHFGHLIADHLTRVIEYLSYVHYVSDTPYTLTGIVFSCEPETRPSKNLVKLIKDIINYFTDEKINIKYINEATTFENLVIAKQGERRDASNSESSMPSKYYQSYLIKNQIKNSLNNTNRNLKLYISRAGLKESNAKFLGHEYIENYIEKQGCLVVRPETLDITTQVRLLSKAADIIIDEGSSLHAFQLLGKISGSVTILSRYLNPSMRLNCINSRLIKPANIVSITAGLVTTHTAANALSLIDFEALGNYFSSPINKAEFKYYCASQLKSYQNLWESKNYTNLGENVAFRANTDPKIKKFYEKLFRKLKF